MSYSLVSSSLCLYVHMHMHTNLHTQNSLLCSAPSSFIHKWFWNIRKKNKPSHSAVQLWLFHDVRVLIVWVVLFIMQNNFRIQSHMGFFTLSNSHRVRSYRPRTTHTHTHTRCRRMTIIFNKLTYYCFSSICFVSCLWILYGDAVGKSIKRTTEDRQKQHGIILES